MENIKVEHAGSRVTRVQFRKEDGSVVRVTVWLESMCNVANNITYFNHQIHTKVFKGRKWQYEYSSRIPKDDRYKNYITEHQLYEAYHVHWNKLDPIRLFTNGQINSDIIQKEGFERLNPDEQLKSY